MADLNAVYGAYEEVFERKEPKGKVCSLLQVSYVVGYNIALLNSNSVQA